MFVPGLYFPGQPLRENPLGTTQPYGLLVASLFFHCTFRPRFHSLHSAQKDSMVGLQILQRQRQVAERDVQAYKGLPVANVSDCMARMTAAGPRLRPMHKS